MTNDVTQCVVAGTVIVVYDIGAELPRSSPAVGNAVSIFVVEDESVPAELDDDAAVLAVDIVEEIGIQPSPGIPARRLA